MLKIIHTGTSLPTSLPVDPTAEFEPGMFAQLKVIGNDIVAGVSDGTAPLGIIDDVKTNAFTRPQVDEVVEINVVNTTMDGNGNIVNSADEVGFLDNARIVESSFTSTVSVALNSNNGAIIVPAGTPLNYDFDEDGTNDGFRIIVTYIYEVANMPGDDSTIGSGRITVHYQRGFYATDQYDTKQNYAMNVTLYVGLDGKITSKQPTSGHPGIAFVTGPPSSTNSTLEFFLL